jgi:hypothetical protein
VLRELELIEAERDVGLDEPVDLIDALRPNFHRPALGL